MKTHSCPPNLLGELSVSWPIIVAITPRLVCYSIYGSGNLPSQLEILSSGPDLHSNLLRELSVSSSRGSKLFAKCFTAAELLQEALAQDNAAVNGLTTSGLAALFAEAWFPSLTPGYGAAGPCWHYVCIVASTPATSKLRALLCLALSCLPDSSRVSSCAVLCCIVLLC